MTLNAPTSPLLLRLHLLMLKFIEEYEALNEPFHNPDQPVSRPRLVRAPRGSRFNILSALQTVGTIAIIVATLFTLWTPANLFRGEIFDAMLIALKTTPQAESLTTPVPGAAAVTSTGGTRIGIVAGHWKDANNPGFSCSDSDLSEQKLNLRIATLVRQKLNEAGYQVDLFQEFDPLLYQYQANVLVSIHNDSCEYQGDDATGFKVAPAVSNSYPEITDRLASCMVDQYQAVTGLKNHSNLKTEDMTDYHSFNEIHSSTPTIIIETGYLNLDKQILSENSDLIAQGIVAGILCFVNNGALPTTTP